jgi:hypothetical protein
MGNNMKEKLIIEFKKMGFREDEINDFLNGLESNSNISKMYNYIVKNNITDTDDVYKYFFKLIGIENQRIIIEK